MEAFGRVVVAAPQHAGEVLPTLVKGCDDEDPYVRARAMERCRPCRFGFGDPRLQTACLFRQSLRLGRQRCGPGWDPQPDVLTQLRDWQTADFRRHCRQRNKRRRQT